MACLVLVNPLKTLARQTILFGVGRALDHTEMQHNLTMIQAVFMANYEDRLKDYPDGHPIHDLFYIVTNPAFYERHRLSTAQEELICPTYVGFEKLTSKWAKENAKGCSCVITSRIAHLNAHWDVNRTHSLSVYF